MVRPTGQDKATCLLPHVQGGDLSLYLFDEFVQCGGAEEDVIGWLVVVGVLRGRFGRENESFIVPGAVDCDGDLRVFEGVYAMPSVGGGGFLFFKQVAWHSCGRESRWVVD